MSTTTPLPPPHPPFKLFAATAAFIIESPTSANVTFYDYETQQPVQYGKVRLIREETEGHIDHHFRLSVGAGPVAARARGKLEHQPRDFRPGHQRAVLQARERKFRSERRAAYLLC
jgi:hypothetical protein